VHHYPAGIPSLADGRRLAWILGDVPKRPGLGFVRLARGYIRAWRSIEYLQPSDTERMSSDPSIHGLNLTILSKSRAVDTCGRYRAIAGHLCCCEWTLFLLAFSGAICQSRGRVHNETRRAYPHVWQIHTNKRASRREGLSSTAAPSIKLSVSHYCRYGRSADLAPSLDNNRAFHPPTTARTTA
jgi:hypothetical protein